MSRRALGALAGLVALVLGVMTPVVGFLFLRAYAFYRRGNARTTG